MHVKQDEIGHPITARPFPWKVVGKFVKEFPRAEPGR